MLVSPSLLVTYFFLLSFLLRLIILYCTVVLPRIFLILPILNFALAAAVLVQEKGQACVDVVHVPKDVIIAWDNPVLLLLPEGVAQASSEVSSGHGFGEGAYVPAVDRLGLPLE